MQPNIVFLDEYSLGDADLGSIRALGNYTGYRTTVREEVADRCREADVVITNKVVFRREQSLLSPHQEPDAGLTGRYLRYKSCRPLLPPQWKLLPQLLFLPLWLLLLSPLWNWIHSPSVQKPQRRLPLQVLLLFS